MTSPAETITEWDTLVDAARRLQNRGIHRLVVTDRERRPVGIVTHSDLLRVFLRRDADIRTEVADLVRRWTSDARDDVAVDVLDGIVVLSGFVRDAGEVRLLVELVETIDGVVDVQAGGLLVESGDEMGG